ncbi:glycosyltransferase [archaeon]|nr:glycosyltransferase [archaeon]
MKFKINRNRLLRHFSILFIVILFIAIINGKFFSAPGLSFLIVYGLTVTFITGLVFTLAHFRYKDLSVEIIKNNLNKNKKRPLISCVFAVYNEEKYVGRCIESLLKSSYKNKEIIVVNDASIDKTLKVLKKYAKHPEVTVLDLKKNVGKKAAIAKGLRIAKGEIYVFTDSDSIVGEKSIERCVEIILYDKNVGGVGGHVRAWNADRNIWTKIQDSWYEGQFSVKKAVESSYGSVSCVSGPLAVFRKEAIFNFIPAWENDEFLGQKFLFSTDRTMTGFVLGSKSIGKKLKEKFKDSWFVKSHDYPLKEWKVVYCKSAKAFTNVPDKFEKIIKQQVRWKKSFIRSIFFSGPFYWKKPFVPAFLFYFKILVVFLGPFIVMRQLIYLPLSGSWFEPLLYFGGIVLVGSMYGLFYKLENPGCHRWVYRPLMSLLSTLTLSWLLFYSVFTIKKMVWHRG